jgi:tyrosine-protein kinase Etk/Wzc
MVKSENNGTETRIPFVAYAEPYNEISFSDLVGSLVRRAKTILWVILASALVSSVVVFLLPSEYTAEAVILTPQQPQPSLSAMVQLAGMGNNSALSSLSLLSGFGLRNPADLYVGVLESRTIADAIINRFGLRSVYRDKYLERARKHLARRTTIRAGKDTLIHIKVDDRDPQRAAALANAYVEELSARNTTVALTEASQRRVFFEEQLAKEKALLAIAEDSLKDTQQFTGLVEPTGQAEALIRSASQLHAEILNRQAELAGMRTYVADENPRLQIVSHELAALRAELATLEKGEHLSGTPEVPVGKLPQAALAYLRKYRDVKYHEGLYEALAKQYEAARLDEAKAAPLIQVIDTAVIPEKRSWPPRTLLILGTVLLSIVLTICCILMSTKREHLS